MALEFKYDEEGGYVEAKLSGVITAEGLRQETIQAAAQLKLHGCARYLSDFSEATVDFSMSDVYQIPELQEIEGIDRSLRIAVVLPGDERGRELGAFYETISVNRGWNAKVFATSQEAIDWLMAG